MICQAEARRSPAARSQMTSANRKFSGLRCVQRHCIAPNTTQNASRSYHCACAARLTLKVRASLPSHCLLHTTSQKEKNRRASPREKCRKRTDLTARSSFGHFMSRVERRWGWRMIKSRKKGAALCRMTNALTVGTLQWSRIDTISQLSKHRKLTSCLSLTMKSQTRSREPEALTYGSWTERLEAICSVLPPPRYCGFNRVLFGRISNKTGIQGTVKS